MATKREHGNETGAEPAKKKVKENYKRVIGKLLNKTTISIDNQRYYTFRFLADNKTEAYYGDAQCFKDLVENDCYSVNLNFVKTKFKEWIQINDYEKCESILEEAAPVKQVLTRADFENEEMVNVLAKLNACSSGSPPTITKWCSKSTWRTRGVLCAWSRWNALPTPKCWPTWPNRLLKTATMLTS